MDENMDRRIERWKIKKEISAADIVSIVSVAIGVLYAYSTLDKRVSILEQSVIVQTNTDRRQDQESIRQNTQNNERFAVIDSKLDKILDIFIRQGNHK